MLPACHGGASESTGAPSRPFVFHGWKASDRPVGRVIPGTLRQGNPALSREGARRTLHADPDGLTRRQEPYDRLPWVVGLGCGESPSGSPCFDARQNYPGSAEENCSTSCRVLVESVHLALGQELARGQEPAFGGDDGGFCPRARMFCHIPGLPGGKSPPSAGMMGKSPPSAVMNGRLRRCSWSGVL